MTPIQRVERVLEMEATKPLGGSLGERQERFATMLPLLLLKAFEMGFKVRVGHAMRCDNCQTGRKKSLHKKKLAIDINLFKDDQYLTATEDHKPLGEYWESLGGSWGGRFSDGNHYSLAWGGMR